MYLKHRGKHIFHSWFIQLSWKCCFQLKSSSIFYFCCLIFFNLLLTFIERSVLRTSKPKVSKHHKKEKNKVSSREDMLANMRWKARVSTRRVCAKQEVMLIRGLRVLCWHLWHYLQVLGFVCYDTLSNISKAVLTRNRFKSTGCLDNLTLQEPLHVGKEFPVTLPGTVPTRFAQRQSCWPQEQHKAHRAAGEAEPCFACTLHKRVSQD